MAKDWEDLAGEKGRKIPTKRLTRLWKMGSVGARMTASMLGRKVADVVTGKSDENGLLRAGFGQQAEKVLEVLGELKGASMKIGQMLSADPDMLPPEFADALTALQRDAPPMPWTTIQEVVQDALDQPLESVFQRFDPEPLGAASIGQVHAARLLTGEEVAVKLQYPGVDASLESDLQNMSSLLIMARMVTDRGRLERCFDEIRTALRQEMDYLHEAENLNRFHEIFAGQPGITVPRPYMDWTRPTLLTMERVEGTKIDEYFAAMTDEDRKAALAERFVRAFAWMFHEQLELHADPHPGNFLVADDETLIFLDFGCTKRCEPHFADGVLRILDACWQGDDEGAADVYEDLGFGQDGKAIRPDPSTLRTYHDIIMEPFLRDRAFDFGAWRVRTRLQSFMLRNPAFIRLVPPPELLLPARVMGGLKGLLARSQVKLNVHQMAVEIAESRGCLTGPPRRG